MSADDKNPDTAVLLEFLLHLGKAYLNCGEQTAVVESYLRRVATARGLRRPRVVAFPTALFLAADDGTTAHATLSDVPPQRLRLDQIAAIYTLGEEAQRAEVSPQEGLQRLEDIARMPPRFGTVGGILGHALLTVGLATVLLPSAANLAAAAVLGLIVGGVKALRRDGPVLAAPLSVVAAGLVATLVFVAIRNGLPLDPAYALIPPLVTFLPGAMLAFGLVEAATGDMMSGASRLINGAVQLMLLAFGLTAGALLVGYRPENLLDGYRVVDVSIWVALAGVALFGLGVFVHYSAPPRSLPWLLLALFVAFGGQHLAAGLLAPELSGFVGMLGATLLGNVIQDRFRGPPAMVTFLPSFWLLVPGALSLISVKHLISATAGFNGLATVAFTFTSVALGTLVGESIYRWVRRRFGE